MIVFYFMFSFFPQMDLIMNCAECRDLVLEAVRYHTDIYNQPLEISSQYTPRGHQGIMLISQNSSRHQVVLQKCRGL